MTALNRIAQAYRDSRIENRSEVPAVIAVLPVTTFPKSGRRPRIALFGNFLCHIHKGHRAVMTLRVRRIGRLENDIQESDC